MLILTVTPCFACLLQGGCMSALRDITDYWVEWLVMFGILALHLGLTFGLPVPDCPTYVAYINPAFHISLMITGNL